MYYSGHDTKVKELSFIKSNEITLTVRNITIHNFNTFNTLFINYYVKRIINKRFRGISYSYTKIFMLKNINIDKSI